MKAASSESKVAPAQLEGAGSTGPSEGTGTTAGPLDGSAEAKRLAAAILDVLAGTRGPSEAAGLLGISLARYYQLETRAMVGLLSACEPRRRGGRPRAGGELAALRQECERLRRDCARQQALVRAAQRTVGLPPPPSAAAPAPPSAGSSNRKRRKRRPRARALKMAAMLRENGGTASVAETGNAVETQPPAAPETTA